ncbi:MAG: adenosylcobalamin-dependent ribonucleoside-diphosphate reductase [Candidatus Delongbacteria bacterium]
MNPMFSHQGKLRSCIGERGVRDYEAVWKHLGQLRDTGALSEHEDYLGGNELARTIYAGKYYVKDLENQPVEFRPEDVFQRVAAFIGAAEADRPSMQDWGARFYTELFEGRFIPGGRVLAGAGDLYRLKTLANCFVSRIDEDSIESLYETAFQCARTYSYGGGIGVDITPLRPRNSVVHNAADCSTGAVSFMELFSQTTGLIGQSGRRGALMLTVDVKHPDVMDFIRVKKDPNWVTEQIVRQCSWSGLFNPEQLKEVGRQVAENTQVRFANISIKASDEFMSAVEEQKKYGATRLLAYRKLGRERVQHAPQDGRLHYSAGIPSKEISRYQLEHVFESLEALNLWLHEETGRTVTADELRDPTRRDVFGDYLVAPRLAPQADLLESLEKDEEWALRESGDFLLYYASPVVGEIRRLVKAREIWDLFVEGNYRTAEPGLIFWTTMSRFSPSNYVGRPVISTNPCAEVPLEDGGACNLGSLNLSRFVLEPYTERARVDWEQLEQSSAVLVRFLDNVVTWNERLNALPKQRTAASETRRLGLGLMGVADMLFQLGLGYDTDEGIELVATVMKRITNASFSASSRLAREKGPSPIFNADDYLRCPFVREALEDETREQIRRDGLRNIAITSIAPTGTISNIVLGYQHGRKNYIGVSGGIEPVFALYYTRRSESLDNQFFKVFHATVQAWIDQHGLTEEAACAEDLETLLPAFFFRTAHRINAARRVDIQGRVQRYVDHSISSTINLPEDVHPELIGDIYLDAWRKGLKGVTVYRDGSRVPILSVEGKESEFQQFCKKRFRATDGGGTLREFAGDEVLRLGDGVLTTPWHVFKYSTLSLEKVLDGSAFQEMEA